MSRRKSNPLRPITEDEDAILRRIGRSQTERILREARRTTVPATDGTATWSLASLQ